jgi:hypothetical protein
MLMRDWTREEFKAEEELKPVNFQTFIRLLVEEDDKLRGKVELPL